MSMLSAQADELRELAGDGSVEFVSGPIRASVLRDAADTILELRDDLQRANDAVQDAEHDESMAWDRVRKADAENAKLQASNEVIAEDHAALCEHNAKLRELCATVIDDWMSKVCPSFPFCEFGGEYQDCTDETCGNQIYRQMARELGVEVDA